MKIFPVATACTCALAAALAASPASATPTIGGDGCMSDLSFTGSSSLVSCFGRYDSNVLDNGGIGDINYALDQLGYAGPDITFASFDATKIDFNGDGNSPIDFAGVFNGTLYFGLKTGGGGPTGVGSNGTTFYKIDAVALDIFHFLPNGASSGGFVVVPSVVPEPETWALLILGFGAMGGALRWTRKRAVVRYA